MYDGFAVFILTYGRHDRVVTFDSLRKQGYTGPIYLLCDDSDATLPQYLEAYGDLVRVFSKREYEGTFDKMDNFGRRNVVVYARNAVFDIAREMGLDRIAVLDDDYNDYRFRIRADGRYGHPRIFAMDEVFAAFLELLRSTEADSVCMAQAGDFIGGKKRGGITSRKVMNLFFFNVDRPVEFIGTINEDLTTSVVDGQKGRLLLTSMAASLNQKITQSNMGGLTDIYLDFGTYVKSFYSVMAAPSCVKVALMGEDHRRFHHEVSWGFAVPKIIREVI